MLAYVINIQSMITLVSESRVVDNMPDDTYWSWSHVSKVYYCNMMLLQQFLLPYV